MNAATWSGAQRMRVSIYLLEQNDFESNIASSHEPSYVQKPPN